MSLVTWSFPTTVVFGNGALSVLPDHVRRVSGKRALVVCDPGVVKAGIAARVQQVLEQAGVAAAVFDRVDPNPVLANVVDGVAAYRAHGADVRRALDVETIVPGHGEPCGKDYLDVQGQIVRDWVGAIEALIDKGMTEDEAVAQGCPPVDPYPIGQRLFPRSAFVDEANVRNVYRQVRARRGAPA